MKARMKRINKKTLRSAIICAIALILIAANLLIDAQPLQPHTYDNTTFKTYTLQSVEHKGDRYEITVAEEAMPLRIDNIASRNVDSDVIKSFIENEQISCYVISGNSDYAYDIVELSQNGKNALTIESTNKAYAKGRQNKIIASSFLVAILAVITVWAFATLHRTSMSNSNLLEKSMMKRELKKENMPKEQIQEFLREMDKYNSLELPCPQEELTAKLSETFYNENGVEYTTAEKYLENKGCQLVFNEMMFDKLGDNELKILHVVTEEKEENEETIYVIYKYRSKLLFNCVVSDEETKKFVIEAIFESWDYPASDSMNKKETQMFRAALREYNRLRENILVLPEDI